MKYDTISPYFKKQRVSQGVYVTVFKFWSFSGKAMQYDKIKLFVSIIFDKDDKFIESP